MSPLGCSPIGTARRRPFPGLVAMLLTSLLALPAAAIVIDNDVPEGTLGHWSVDVGVGGEVAVANITAEPRVAGGTITADVVFSYDSYVDPGADGEGFQLSNPEGLPVADPNDPDRVTSAGTFVGAHGNTIRWEVTSAIANGTAVMVNTLRLTAEGGVLGPLRFFQHLDEDVPLGSSNDLFFQRGSGASGDLQLFTVDSVEVYGVSQSGALNPSMGLANAQFAGWAADQYDNIVPRITGTGDEAGALVSLEGQFRNLPTVQDAQLGTVFGPEDIVSVLAWDVNPSATSATIVTSLGGVPSGSALTCGDGRLDEGEACDLGAANGGAGGCCTAVCRFRPAGETCRASTGVCDPAETCTGQGGECPADLLAPDGQTCDSGDACTGDACQAGSCVSPAACDAVDIGATPLDENLTGKKTPTVISVGLANGQAGSVEAAGFEETVAVADAMGTASAIRPPADAGRPVTSGVRRKLKAGSGRRAVLRLRLNPLGRKRLAQAGSLRVRVVVRVAPRGGAPATLIFRRFWQR